MSNSWAREKVDIPERAFRMTVHQRNEESRESSFPEVSPCSKNNWPEMDNDSSSWDRNSRATSSSWPGDMEEAATRKVLQLWDAIERNLFGEVDDESFDPVADECNQWRTQLTHLRLVGKSLTSAVTQDSNNETVRSASRRSRTGDQSGEEIIMEDSLDEYKLQDLNGTSRYQPLHSKIETEDHNEVFDQIFDFVYSELSKQKEKRETDDLGRNLDDVLRITPAPTCSGRKTMKGRKKRGLGGSRKSSANENRPDGTTDAAGGVEENSRTLSETSREAAKNSTENDGNVETDVPQVARNKLGTVFNEKIVVSPVPFVVSQRESFTTLRTTPISFRTQTFEISTPQGLGRYLNSGSKTTSEQRLPGSRVPQIHSAWQAPVCPTVWPKNIRLAPIDPSRLPSSRNRSSSDLPALPHRNRNSLSPIMRPSKPIPSATLRDHNGEGLEIQGKQIVTRSPKQKLLKTGSPRNAKSSRTKARTQKR